VCQKERKTKTKQKTHSSNTLCVIRRGKKKKKKRKKKKKKRKSQNELASAAGMLPAASTIFIKQLCQTGYKERNKLTDHTHFCFQNK